MHAQTTSTETPKTRATPRKDKQEMLYNELLADIQLRFKTAVEKGLPMFTTEGSHHLWDIFLSELPPSERQHYTCHSCRRFIEKYGGLVMIDSEGRQTPVAWSPFDGFGILDEPVHELNKYVSGRKITGVFLSDQKTWGEPKTGPWLHMAAKLKVAPFKATPLKSADQAMAEKLEDFGMLGRVIDDFNLHHVSQAVELLSSDALYRSEKVLGAAKWFQQVLEGQKKAKGRARANLLWQAVATAPVGFCHVRTSMIGTLLEDLAAGLPFEDVRKKFATKMNPLAYQRPQAAPKAGNIEQAEKIFETLGLARSLKR